MNGDGRIALVINEMLGNGLALPATEDVGNLVIISGSISSARKIPLLPALAGFALGLLAAGLARRSRCRGDPGPVGV